MDTTRSESEAGAPRLGLFDAVSLIVGVIIGVGIFETPASVFASAAGPWVGLLVWVIGGLFALIGAFCFAELASAYPHSGGEYVYLKRAFGPLVGYLFAWAQFCIIRPGSIAAVAYVMAFYVRKFCAAVPGAETLSETEVFFVAAGAIAALTIINVLGVELGTRTQNVLTIAKVLGLGALVVAGAWVGWSGEAVPAPSRPADDDGLAVALIFAMWTYAGWQEAAYVASEVKRPRRNLPLALLLGTASVLLIYLAVNGAYLLGLGFDGARSTTLAADLLERAWPGYGARVMALAVVVSALGALNGMIFTSARICTVFAADHPLFVPLSRWSHTLGTPARALVVQGLMALALAAGVWYWGEGRQSFDDTVALTAAVFWGFFLLTGIALPVLRHRDPDAPRTFRVPGYPVLPLVFCAGSLYMIAGAVRAFAVQSLIGLAIVAAGLPFYFLSDWLGRPRRPNGGRAPTPTPDLVVK